MKRLEPHLRVASASPTTATYDGRQIPWEFTEFSRFHGTTKLRKTPSFRTSWESPNRHDPNHYHSLPSDSVFIDITSSCWRNERQNWEIPTFTCARRVTGYSNLQHTPWLSYNIPRNSDLIRQHDYICSHGLTFVTNHYHAVSDNLSLHFKSCSCYLEVTTEYVRNMFIICV